MSDVRVKKLNSTYLQVDANSGVIRELWEHFSFQVPGCHFMPSYKTGRWDGYIRLLSPKTRKIYAGLHRQIKEFCDISGYNFIPESTDWEVAPGESNHIDFDDFACFLEGLNLHAGGQKITPRSYQLEAIFHAITERGSLLISPTASGKSLIIYCVMRWIRLQSDKPIVLVVPTTSLVEQMYKDFAEYSQFDDNWDVEEHCNRVYSGKSKVTSGITITTWQSLVKFPKKYLQDCVGVIGDEAHTFTAKSLSGIMENCINAHYRLGTTGTLKDGVVNEMVLEGLFGPIKHVTTTKKLMDDGHVSELAIKIIRLKYPSDTCKLMKKADYNSEVSFINSHEWRNKYIRNLTLDLDGNTIVMFRHVDHGRHLYNLLKEKAHKKRKIFLVYGGTETDTREEIRAIVEKEENAIIVASLGTFSTGINIRNIHNIVFAAPTKSSVKVLQSIGRGLRKSTDGRGCILIDIVDDLSVGKKANYTFKHGAQRLEMYVREKFNYEMITINTG